MSKSFTVVGVMPPDFHFPSKAISPGWGYLSGAADVFEPLVLSPYHQLASMHTQLVIARLKPGVAVAQADAEMKLIAARLERQYPQSKAGRGFSGSAPTRPAVGQAPP